MQNLGHRRWQPVVSWLLTCKVGGPRGHRWEAGETPRLESWVTGSFSSPCHGPPSFTACAFQTLVDVQNHGGHQALHILLFPRQTHYGKSLIYKLGIERSELHTDDHGRLKPQKVKPR